MSSEARVARSKKQLVRDVFGRLSDKYGAPKWRRSGPAIDTLIHTILSQNTNDRNSGEGFRRLKAAFPDWASVEKARWRKVAAAIRVSGLANIKSRRIQKALRGIREERGNYSIEFLKRLPPHEARDYLLAIPGVGPKTAACVLVFSFGVPVFPVDTHIHRVTGRLGLVPERTGAAEAHDRLQKLVPPEWVYPLHMLLIRHGRDTCAARKPKCEECVLRCICPYGKSGVQRRQRAGRSARNAAH